MKLARHSARAGRARRAQAASDPGAGYFRAFPPSARSAYAGATAERRWSGLSD